MPFLKQSDIKIGTLVLDQDPRTLKTVVCVITGINTEGGRVQICFPDGRIDTVNALYIRSMP